MGIFNLSYIKFVKLTKKLIYRKKPTSSIDNVLTSKFQNGSIHS